MSPVSFQAIDKNLEHVFCADYLFEVPGYQRPYSWKTEHAQALFDDILEFVCSDGNGKKITELPAYFLGSILLIKKTSDPKADIVDGQQRLTTLTILLSAIRSLHNERAVKEAITEVIYQKGNKVTGAENIYRLKLRELDQKFFQEYLYNPHIPDLTQLVPYQYLLIILNHMLQNLLQFLLYRLDNKKKELNDYK